MRARLAGVERATTVQHQTDLLIVGFRMRAPRSSLAVG